MRSFLAMALLILASSGCQKPVAKPQVTASLDQARASYEQALIEQTAQTNGVLTEIRDILQSQAKPEPIPEPVKSVEPFQLSVPDFASPPPPPSITEARVLELINQRLAAFKPIQQAVYQPSTQAPRSTVVSYQTPEVRSQAVCSGGVCATPTSYVRPRLIWRRR